MLNDATSEFLNKLENQLGKNCLRAPEPRDLSEPRGMYTGQAAAVLRPTDTHQVSDILAACNAARVGVVPMAGNTGLTGGQTLQDGALPVIISMERMTNIREISVENNTMTVESGTILADIRAAASNENRLFPLALASEGTCRIGGNLATNAGGVNVLRYGNTRDLCLGLEAVLADGTIIGGLKSLRKDNTDYDLRHLMIGSEGTLGIITTSVLRLYPQPKHQFAAMLAVPSPKEALALLTMMSDQLEGRVSAFELIDRTGLDFLIEKVIPFKEPFLRAYPWMVLMDCGGGDGLQDAMEQALAKAMEAGLVVDAVLSQTLGQHQALWQIRETIPEANKKIGPISSHDISVPIARVPAFIDAAHKLVDRRFRINCFGHMGDGNLHYNVFPPKGDSPKNYLHLQPEINGSIYDLVAEFGGSFSAEHGIGRLKAADLAHYGDKGQLLAMRKVKDALDPNGIMNPGAVFA